MAQNDKKVCHASYLRKHTSYDFHLWYICIKKKRKKWSKVRKNSVCHTTYLKNHASYDFHVCVYGTYDNISRKFFFFFFHFLKFWFSRFLGRSKGQKIFHKKLCPFHLISKEPYIIWLSFVVHKCKLMISPGFFSKFWFFGLLVG